MSLSADHVAHNIVIMTSVYHPLFTLLSFKFDMQSLATLTGLIVMEYMWFVSDEIRLIWP